ncbi:MAG: hypothetical protein H7338_16555 [Candidatus Sericytochromatia bacterium]|nr:hypothetical protein [Candidatus Sericytochromatia bacterium]
MLPREIFEAPNAIGVDPGKCQVKLSNRDIMMTGILQSRGEADTVGGEGFWLV